MTRRSFGMGLAAILGGLIPGWARASGLGATQRIAELPDGWDADDPEHPIPYLDRLDVWAVKEAGGATLAIIVATPLQDDRRSLERLMRKFDNYLGFINSAEFRERCGKPDPSNTEVEVVIHPASSTAAFALLDRCRPWVEEQHARLVVTRKA